MSVAGHVAVACLACPAGFVSVLSLHAPGCVLGECLYLADAVMYLCQPGSKRTYCAIKQQPWIDRKIDVWFGVTNDSLVICVIDPHVSVVISPSSPPTARLWAFQITSIV